MAGMTDQTLVGTLLKNLLYASGTATWTPGTGGTSLTITPPLRLHLMTTTGTESAAGTEMTAVSGYVAGFNATGGLSMGTNAFTAPSAGTTANGNVVTWTAGATWTQAINGIEVYDGASTAVRILWGALASAIGASVVVSGDTVSFAVGAITVSAATW
jgi:hypothetical protein